MDQISPIIVEFLSAKESLGAVLQKYCNEEQSLEFAFLKLSKEAEGGEVNQGLLKAIDKAIIEGHPDVNLYLFFICQVTTYFHKHNQIEKAKALLLIASSITEKVILPFIKAIYYNHLAMHKRYLGEIAECKALMSKSIALVEKSEPRARVLLQNYMTNIAFNGQLRENGEYKLNELFGLPPQTLLMVALQVKIINCIITGNYFEGLALIEEVKKMNQPDLDTNLKTYGDLLKLSSGDFDEANYLASDGKLMACAYYHFSNERYDEAMKYHSMIKDKFTISNMNLSFGYMPLHYQLCLKKSGPAKLFLQEKIKKGDEFYIDDLFCGRIQLLENDEEGANESFLRLIENVTRYGAMKRLEFDLQFAKEMKLPVILRLLNGWKEDGSSSLKKKKIEKPQKVINDEKGIKRLIGSSPAISHVKELVKKYAGLKVPVLITGETGTGKELVSRALHDEGAYPTEPFLAINCGALTDNLLQSELFGYEAGSFTGALKQRKGVFEAAGKGTVFLDEFGEISPKLQVSLLRVLEANEIRMIGSTTTQQIECKIVIATNVDLHDAVVTKKFREDLFFRISRFEIRLPSLRERVEDIPYLIDYFLKASSSGQENQKAVSMELLNTLITYHWPGNIRELKNEIERLYILNPGKDLLDSKDFDFSHLQVKEEVKPILQASVPSVAKVSQQSLTKNEEVLKIISSGFRIDKRLDYLKELFKEHKKLTRSQIIKITNVGPTTATKDLLTLTNAGFIVRRSPTKSSSTDYFELVVEDLRK